MSTIPTPLYSGGGAKMATGRSMFLAKLRPRQRVFPAAQRCTNSGGHWLVPEDFPERSHSCVKRSSFNYLQASLGAKSGTRIRAMMAHAPARSGGSACPTTTSRVPRLNPCTKTHKAPATADGPGQFPNEATVAHALLRVASSLSLLDASAPCGNWHRQECVRYTCLSENAR